MNALGSSLRSLAKFSAPCYGVYARAEILEIGPKVTSHIHTEAFFNRSVSFSECISIDF